MFVSLGVVDEGSGNSTTATSSDVSDAFDLKNVPLGQNQKDNDSLSLEEDIAGQWEIQNLRENLTYILPIINKPIYHLFTNQTGELPQLVVELNQTDSFAGVLTFFNINRSFYNRQYGENLSQWVIKNSTLNQSLPNQFSSPLVDGSVNNTLTISVPMNSKPPSTLTLSAKVHFWSNQSMNKSDHHMQEIMEGRVYFSCLNVDNGEQCIKTTPVVKTTDRLRVYLSISDSFVTASLSSLSDRASLSPFIRGSYRSSYYAFEVEDTYELLVFNPGVKGHGSDLVNVTGYFALSTDSSVQPLTVIPVYLPDKTAPINGSLLGLLVLLALIGSLLAYYLLILRI